MSMLLILFLLAASTSTAFTSIKQSHHHKSIHAVVMGITTSSNSGATTPTIKEEDHHHNRSIITQPSISARSEFRNKSILITGASRGLGRSLALALSSCNPSLIVLSGRDEIALKRVREECASVSERSSRQGRGRSAEKTTTKVEIVVCDLANRASVEQLAEASLNLARNQHNSHSSKGDAAADGVDNSGTIDILINNGGISSRSSFLETSIDVDERLMQVNFFSGVALAKKLVPSMIAMDRGTSSSSTAIGGEKKKRRIIWISSIQGKLGTPYRSSYAASKFAIQGYCESLRSELSSSNVDVHIVSPGYIRTNLSQSAVMGDGRSYSKTDETTANGAHPDMVAVDILNTVARGNADFLVAATLSAKIAIWLRFLLPSLLNRLLVKRFEKQRIVVLKEKNE